MLVLRMKIIRPLVVASIFASAHGSFTRHGKASGRKASSAHLGSERAIDTTSPATIFLDHKHYHLDIWEFMSWESYDKEELAEEMTSAKGWESRSSAACINRLLWQLLFGLIYYFLIVAKYPILAPYEVKSEEVIEYKKQNALEALLGASFQNILLSICCTGPRAAHTMSVTGALNYWPALMFMSMFPCCTLIFADHYSDMNEALGGEKRSTLQSVMCATCCLCCVVAQDAQALDMVTGAQTGFFKVYTDL
mmetsp:Transcript_8320/g.14321  ORF Transcript_8320/g.14321 Transcript_8320/m.14321 type:complete len:251 (+) Transcript_8320:48-800(+)